MLWKQGGLLLIDGLVTYFKSEYNKCLALSRYRIARPVTAMNTRHNLLPSVGYISMASYSLGRSTDVKLHIKKGEEKDFVALPINYKRASSNDALQTSCCTWQEKTLVHKFRIEHRGGLMAREQANGRRHNVWNLFKRVLLKILKWGRTRCKSKKE